MRNRGNKYSSLNLTEVNTKENPLNRGKMDLSHKKLDKKCRSLSYPNLSHDLLSLSIALNLKQKTEEKETLDDSPEKTKRENAETSTLFLT